MGTISHEPIAGPNDPTKQVSKTVYEAAHTIAGTFPPDAHGAADHAGNIIPASAQLFPDGTEALPSVAIGETTSGWRRISAGILAASILGVERLRLSATELLVGTSVSIKGPSPWADLTAWGGDPTGVADSATAWANATNSLPTGTPSGGTLFAYGLFKMNSVLTLKSNINYRGAGRNATIITNSSSDVFTWATETTGWNIEDMRIDADVGHIFAPTAGTAECGMRNLQLTQYNVAKSIWTSSGVLYIDNLVEHCDLSVIAGTRTVPAWNLISSGDGINSNTWRRLRLNGNNTDTPFFYIEESTAANYAFDNVFEDITAEQCDGGIIHAYSSHSMRIENVQNYDTTTFTGSIFKFGKTTGPATRNVVIINSGRRGGAIGAFFDVEMEGDSIGLTLINVGPPAATPAYSIPASHTSSVNPHGGWTSSYTAMGFFGVAAASRPAALTQTYATADRTHANPTAAALTVTDGAGTNDNTIDAITADVSVIAAFQEIADEVNRLVADMADIKQFVNSIADDLQSLGLEQ